MPLAARTETAVTAVAGLMDDIDAIMLAYLAGRRRRLPAAPAVAARVEPLVAEAVAVEMGDIATVEEQAEAVAVIVASIVATVREAFDDARRTKRRVAPVTPDPEGSRWERVAATVAAAIAAGIPLRRIRRRGNGPNIRTLSRIRPYVRTAVAEARNIAVLDRVGPGGVVLVRDALKGPTDEPCERVSGRFATVAWARRNLSEHPNCTRQFVPHVLAPGERVTLR